MPKRHPILSIPLWLAAVLLLGVGLQALADDDEAEQALRSGDAVPIEQLLAEIRRGYEGRILRVELEPERRAGERVWVYEAKILTPQGDVIKLEYDARSLELLEIQRPRARRGASDAGDG